MHDTYYTEMLRSGVGLGSDTCAYLLLSVSLSGCCMRLGREAEKGVQEDEETGNWLFSSR